MSKHQARKRNEERKRREARRLAAMRREPTELPEVLVIPGAHVEPIDGNRCRDERHAPEVWGAAMAWANGARFPMPQRMDCGCLIAAIGMDWDEADRLGLLFDGAGNPQPPTASL
jgi:hypothetical protein